MNKRFSYSCMILKSQSSNLLLWYLEMIMSYHAIQESLIVACSEETTKANQAKNAMVQRRTTN